MEDAAGAWNAIGRVVQYNYAGINPYVNSFPCDNQGSGGMLFARNIDGAGSTIASTTSCWVNGVRTMFSITFDFSESWYTGTSTTPGTQYDLLGVATHEFGHAYGFSGHFSELDDQCDYNSTRATMCYGSNPGDDYKRTLEAHDIHTVPYSVPSGGGGGK